MDEDKTFTEQIQDIDWSWPFFKSILQIDSRRINLIGIGGGECTGKSFLAAKIRHLGSEHGVSVTVIPLDGYLKFDRAARMQFSETFGGDTKDAIRIGDHPLCFDLQRLRKDLLAIRKEHVLATRWSYDYTEGKIIATEKDLHFKAGDLVIVEGIFAFTEDLAAIYDRKIFLTSSFSTVQDRYVRRYQKSKRLDSETALAKLIHYVQPAYDNHILPNKAFADVILSNDTSATLPR